MVYNMDFYDSFGVLLFLMLMLVAVASVTMKMVYGIYHMIVKRKWHIYRTSNLDEYNKFLSELDMKKYELINVVNHHNRKGEDEYLVIYQRKKLDLNS